MSKKKTIKIPISEENEDWLRTNRPKKEKRKKEKVLKLARQDPEFRRDLISKLAAKPQSDYELAVLTAKNDGKHYRKRDAQGAVRAAMREQGLNLSFREMRKAIEEVKQIWRSEEEDPWLNEY